MFKSVIHRPGTKLAGTLLRTREELIARCPNLRAQYSTDINSINRIRNIGIIAHIDAGKTTTTERMLYYSGVTNRIGDVDQGDTVMDYLPAERDRGITITSAAITFNWGGHKMNLIDTPGHADFTFEVIRSIRVLDGAVTVLDGVAGVEAQTEKVWKQANEMNIPKVVFVNKMDRAGAGFGRTVKEVVSKLNTRVGIVNMPYFGENPNKDMEFKGVIDVIDKKLIQWKSDSDGKEVVVSDVSDSAKEELSKARAALVENLCEVNEELVEEFLEIGDYMEIPASSIKKALRQATLDRDIVPVLCGASFRNIGVQPLLQAIIDYLPSPEQRPPPHAITKHIPKSMKSSNRNNKDKKSTQAVGKQNLDEQVIVDPESKELTCALAFKVVNDPIRGIMVFVRVYSGRLQQNTTVINTSNGKKERISRLLQMQADMPTEINTVERGNIAVIVGSKDIRTGDTIVAHTTRKDGAHHLSDRDKNIHLQPIKVPPPVFFASIEPITLSDRRGMDEALDILMREDPSLHLTYDMDSDQTLISGMGELHLDIANDRLVNNLKAKVEMGSIQVSYKETIQASSNEVHKVVDSDDDKTQATVKVQIEPVMDEEFEGELLDHDNNYLTFPETIASHAILSHQEICQAIRVGALPALARGGKVAYLPLHSCRVVVSSVDISADAVSTTAISNAVRLAAEEALGSLSKRDYTVMEPIMDVRVILNKEDIGVVVNDMSGNRQGHIISLGEETPGSESDGHYAELAEKTYTPPDHTLYLSKHEARTSSQQSVVHARVALAKMVGYLPTLRSMTQGRGTYLLDFYKYERALPNRVQEIVDGL